MITKHTHIKVFDITNKGYLLNGLGNFNKAI